MDIHSRFIAAHSHGKEGLIAVVSTRLHGRSIPPFSSLNLGKSTTDQPETVAENRHLLYKDLALSENQVAISGQVHGTEIRTVHQPDMQVGFDGMTTQTAGIVLSISVADCVPILIWDPVKRSCAALHAGWRGSVGNISALGIASLQKQFDSQPENCYAFVGPCISFKSFEVDADVADHIPLDFKTWNTKTKKWHVDLKAYNAHQLLAAGLPKENIEISSYCTVLQNDLFFSHRAEKGKTGRMMALVGWR